MKKIDLIYEFNQVDRFNFKQLQLTEMLDRLFALIIWFIPYFSKIFIGLRRDLDEIFANFEKFPWPF